MKPKPTSTELLTAIQDFLMKDILPFVKESDELSYKTLVSWNMLGLVSREIKLEEETHNNELQRLLTLFPQLESHFGLASTISHSTTVIQGLDRETKIELLKKMNSLLAKIIREYKIIPQRKSEPFSSLYTHVIQTLEEELSISNPRFSS